MITFFIILFIMDKFNVIKFIRVLNVSDYFVRFILGGLVGGGGMGFEGCGGY